LEFWPDSGDNTLVKVGHWRSWVFRGERCL